MKSWAKWTAKTVVLVTGFVAAGGGLAGVALAGTGTLGTAPASTGNVAAVSGNWIFMPISIPVNICGNAVGNATAHCPGGVWLPADEPVRAGSGGRHIGNLDLASGNMVTIPVSVPVNVCGNAVAVLGDSTAGCAGGASVGLVASAGQHSWPHKTNMARMPKAHLTNLTNLTKKAGPHPLKPVQLARIGAQPVASGMLGLVQPLLRDIPLLDGTALTAATTHSATSLPAARLAALQASVAGQPMSDNSLVALTLGALLTGAAALKVAGRGFRARRSATATVVGTGGQEVAS